MYNNNNITTIKRTLAGSLAEGRATKTWKYTNIITNNTYYSTYNKQHNTSKTNKHLSEGRAVPGAEADYTFHHKDNNTKSCIIIVLLLLLVLL